MKNTTHLILGMLALTFGMEVKAQIQLPSVFSDGMVLQQNSKVAVWGWGNPSETLMILSEWNPGDTVRTVLDNQGRWKAELPTGRAGGPYTLEVKGGNDSRKLSDVMLGEVWLCSGQSNMEWSANMGIMNGEQEVKQAASPSVRIFHNIIPSKEPIHLRPTAAQSGRWLLPKVCARPVPLLTSLPAT